MIEAATHADGHIRFIALHSPSHRAYALVIGLDPVRDMQCIWLFLHPNQLLSYAWAHCLQSWQRISKQLLSQHKGTLEIVQKSLSSSAHFQCQCCHPLDSTLLVLALYTPRLALVSMKTS